MASNTNVIKKTNDSWYAKLHDLQENCEEIEVFLINKAMLLNDKLLHTTVYYKELCRFITAWTIMSRAISTEHLKEYEDKPFVLTAQSVFDVITTKDIDSAMKELHSFNICTEVSDSDEDYEEEDYEVEYSSDGELSQCDEIEID